MRCTVHSLPVFLLFGLMVCTSPRPLQGASPDADPLVFVSSVNVGGQPSAIIVDHATGHNDVVFYDGDKVRFLDGDTLALAPQQIYLPTTEWAGWMDYDRVYHQTYVVTVQSRETPMRVRWKEVQVHVVAGRSTLGSFSVNAGYNTDPLNPPDQSYAVAGLVLKQPLSEGDHPARLIVDDAKNGNVDVVDLNPQGTAAARLQRYSYRDPVSGSTSLNAGNTLALEPKHETLATDDLAASDLLYIADKNRWQGGAVVNGRIRTIRLSHPLQDLNAVPLSDVDLSGTWPFNGGVQGISAAGPRDILYVASMQQSFDDGYIAEVSTTSGQPKKVITLQYADEGFVHVDWHDPRRAFVVTFDGWYNDPQQALYLHLVYDGTVVDTLRLIDNYDEYNGLRGMAFDPLDRRLYLTVGSSIMVVQINYGDDPLPTCPNPLTGVQIAGPILGQPNLTYAFSALPTPGDATQPVTYAWSPQPLSGQGTSSANYQWSTAGTHSISLEAENCGGKGTASHSIRLGDWPQVYLPMILWKAP